MSGLHVYWKVCSFPYCFCEVHETWDVCQLQGVAHREIKYLSLSIVTEFCLSYKVNAEYEHTTQLHEFFPSSNFLEALPFQYCLAARIYFARYSTYVSLFFCWSAFLWFDLLSNKRQTLGITGFTINSHGTQCKNI